MTVDGTVYSETLPKLSTSSPDHHVTIKAADTLANKMEQPLPLDKIKLHCRVCTHPTSLNGHYD